MELTKAFVAFIPIIWLFLSLGVMKMTTYKACSIGLILTGLLAMLTFNMPGKLLAQSILEGTVYSVLSISWIIVAALLVYNITLKTGALNIIKKMLTNISLDRRMQALIIGFAFGGFLEAVAGFGTSVAIPAGILIAMGFPPLKAAVVCLVSNTVPVALGVLGIPAISLAETTGLQLEKIIYYMCIQLLPFAIVLPLLVVFIVTNDIRKLKGAILPSLLSGLTFAIGQTTVAMFIGVELAAAVGSLCALLTLVIWCKAKKNKQNFRFENDNNTEDAKEDISFKDIVIAWSPYILILIFIILVQLFPFFNKTPFLLSKQFYFGNGGKPITFNWLTSGGSILFMAALIGGIVQGMRVKTFFLTIKETLWQVKFSVLTIVLVVSLAKVMTYCGMISESAMLIAAVSGKFFPFMSPLIGALGTFITGSDTSSNILFGGLQQQTALNLGLNEYWITAGNGAGATAGKMISPQSISIASASIYNAAKENEMMEATIKYCIVYVILMGLFVYFGQMLML